jgi:hypothetical protein
MKSLPLFISLASLAGIAVSSCVVTENEPGNSDSTEIQLASPQPFAHPTNDDEAFFNFRLEHFAPATEPLIKETFGSEPALNPESFWEYNSYTSHAVGFATNLPTVSLIEYGETTDYSLSTGSSDSYYYQHLHHIKNLQTGTTYHYRIRMRDCDGREIASGDHTFTTAVRQPDVVRIPDDFDTPPPYVLAAPNTRYVLTQDLNAPTLAIKIKASNVTLDLDGHTITYDNAPSVAGGAWNDYAYNEEATFGIRSGLWNFMNIKLFNGVIRQGRNGGAGFIGIGFNPVFLFHMGSGSRNEVAGVVADYFGNSVTGMYTGDSHTHHNVVIDRGTVIDDRHQGIDAIRTESALDNETAFNSIRRFRHRGIRGNGHTHHNELYSDSFDTNSFLISAFEGGRVEDNKLFGMGYNPVGIGWSNHSVTRRNFIYLHGTAPTQRSTEYARRSGIAGMRITNYDGDPYEDMLYEDNVIVLKAEDGCSVARGIWTSNAAKNSGIIYRRNTVKVEAMPGNVADENAYFYTDDVNNAVAAVTVCDDDWVRPQDGSQGIPGDILFEDNHLIGNVNLIILGEGYGIGSSVRMVRTRLEKIAHDSQSFRPVRLGFWYWNTFNNRLIDTELIRIADDEMTPHFYGDAEGHMEISYGESHELSITAAGSPLRNADVTLTLNDGLRTLQGKTDPNGKLAFDLLTVQHLKSAAAAAIRTDYSRYTFEVAGFRPCTIATAQLKNTASIALTN